MDTSQEIDWAQAPTYATHWEPHGLAAANWMRYNEGHWYYWHEKWILCFRPIAERIARMIPRPAGSLVWDGVGEPLVNSLVEYDGKVHRVLGYCERDNGKRVIVMAERKPLGGDGKMLALVLDCIVLRKIPTEKEAWIEKVLSVSGDDELAELLGRLYDAGLVEKE